MQAAKVTPPVTVDKRGRSKVLRMELLPKLNPLVVRVARRGRLSAVVLEDPTMDSPPAVVNIRNK